jgi:CDGSH-type Zn-finger protein
MHQEGRHRMPERIDVTITVRDNGPYVVEGPARIVDADGNEFSTEGRKRISLCRCGGSVTKPFCDGTHSRLGFAAAERAVAEAEEKRKEG